MDPKQNLTKLSRVVELSGLSSRSVPKFAFTESARKFAASPSAKQLAGDLQPLFEHSITTTEELASFAVVRSKSGRHWGQLTTLANYE